MNCKECNDICGYDDDPLCYSCEYKEEMEARRLDALEGKEEERKLNSND